MTSAIALVDSGFIFSGVSQVKLSAIVFGTLPYLIGLFVQTHFAKLNLSTLTWSQN